MSRYRFRGAGSRRARIAVLDEHLPARRPVTKWRDLRVRAHDVRQQIYLPPVGTLSWAMFGHVIGRQ